MKNPFESQIADPSQLPFSYREFLAERDEILKIRRRLSQVAGYDVDFDLALMDWMTNHRESWIATRSRQISAA
ncbi:MAG: hypothetical protein KGS60_11815 [Verrucomicrobia bacterium]|nr:hypothetical protein [Verrucomicrobiota bacterium]